MSSGLPSRRNACHLLDWSTVHIRKFETSAAGYDPCSILQSLRRGTPLPSLAFTINYSQDSELTQRVLMLTHPDPVWKISCINIFLLAFRDVHPYISKLRSR